MNREQQMDLRPFLDNPIIDELDWLESSGNRVTQLVPIVSEDGTARVRFVGPTVDHELDMPAGFFRTIWTDATEVLSSHENIEPLSPLDPQSSARLEPSEARHRASLEDLRLSNRERDRARAIQDARDELRAGDVSRARDLLEPWKQELEGSAQRMYEYVRERAKQQTP